MHFIMLLLYYPWINDELVHSPWTKSCPDSVHNGLTGIDVGDDLLLPSRILCPLLQKQDLRLHRDVLSEGTQKVKITS